MSTIYVSYIMSTSKYVLLYIFIEVHCLNQVYWSSDSDTLLV